MEGTVGRIHQPVGFQRESLSLGSRREERLIEVDETGIRVQFGAKEPRSPVDQNEEWLAKAYGQGSRGESGRRIE